MMNFHIKLQLFLSKRNITVELEKLKKYTSVFIGSIIPGIFIMLTYKTLLSFGLTDRFVNSYYLIMNSQLLGGIVGSAFSSLAIKTAGSSSGSFFGLRLIHAKIFLASLGLYTIFALFGNLLSAKIILIDKINAISGLALIVSFDIYLRSWFIGAGKFVTFAAISLINSAALSVAFTVCVLFSVISDPFYILLFTLSFGLLASIFFIGLTTQKKPSSQPLDTSFSVRPLIPLIISGLAINAPFLIVSAQLKVSDVSEFNKLAIALQLFSLIVFLPNIIVKVAAPKLMWNFDRNPKKFCDTFSESCKAGILVSLALFLASVLAVGYINNAYGNSFAGDHASLGIWLCCAAFVGAQYPLGTVLLSAGKFWTICILNIIWFIAFFGTLEFFHILSFKGLAFALLISYLILAVFNILAVYKVLVKNFH